MSVLIVGASGSIGTYAVQLARSHGATVTGVCSTRNVEPVSTLGADEVIDYTRDDPTAARDRYDIVFDTVGKSSFAAMKPALKPGGAYVSTMIGPGDLLKQFSTRLFGTKRVIVGMSVEKNDHLATVRQLLESGRLQVVVDQQYPLKSIADAHRHVETGRKIGNVVVTVP